MSRRRYDQACSIAAALDHIGERWSLLVVRELLLGPLRFSDLARAVGGAPTDVLTRRLRDLESDDVVRRVELGPPSGATVYELTELGRELEEPLLALGRWGLNFYRLDQIAGIEAISMPGPLQVVLDPPPDLELILQIHSEGYPSWLRIEAGEMRAGRGEAPDPDIVATGPPAALLLALAPGGSAGGEVTIDGDPALLERLRASAELPPRLSAQVRALVAAAGVATPEKRGVATGESYSRAPKDPAGGRKRGGGDDLIESTGSGKRRGALIPRKARGGPPGRMRGHAARVSGGRGSPRKRWAGPGPGGRLSSVPS